MGRLAGMIGNRKRHCDLAIVLLAEPTAILPRDAHRMRAFFRKAGIVDDPGFDPIALSFDRGHDPFANPPQNRLVRPRRLTDEMQKR